MNRVEERFNSLVERANIVLESKIDNVICDISLEKKESLEIIIRDNLKLDLLDIKELNKIKKNIEDKDFKSYIEYILIDRFMIELEILYNNLSYLTIAEIEELERELREIEA